LKRSSLSAVAIAFSIFCAWHPVLAQSQSPAQKYADAKTLIKKARALLREYLQSNPTGANGYNAKIQFDALEHLLATDIPIAPVPLDNQVTWRILSIDPEDSYTKVHLEFENTNQISDTTFHWFDHSPLTLLANGKTYAMDADGLKLPDRTIEANDGNNFDCVLQGGQIVTADVYFEPLDTGIVVGTVKYRDRENTTAANFSLLNSNQKVEK